MLPLSAGFATVKAVLSGDLLVLMGASKNGPPPVRRVALANVRAPRLGRPPAGVDEVRLYMPLCCSGCPSSWPGLWLSSLLWWCARAVRCVAEAGVCLRVLGHVFFLFFVCFLWFLACCSCISVVVVRRLFSVSTTPPFPHPPLHRALLLCLIVCFLRVWWRYA